MPTLDEIREKVPNARYEPEQDCPKCKGAGLYSLPPEKAAQLPHIQTTDIPCRCLFFAKADAWVHNLLRDIAREGLNQIQGTSIRLAKD